MNRALPGKETLAGIKKLSYIGSLLFFIAFLVLHYFVLTNLIILSQDVLFGDRSAEQIKPAPQYGFLRIPDSRLARKYEAYNHLGADFAQIYFPLKQKNGLMQDYIHGTYDPWDRPSRIAPLVHHLCARTFCRFKYGPASLFHLYLQLVLFYVAFIAVFLSLKIDKYLPLGILLVNVGLFLTPAGISWFERGQYSLYVAIAYLFVLLGIIKNKPVYFLLGGIFAFIKWTSFPTLFVLIVIYILASRDIRSLRSKILIVSPFVATILILLAVFSTEGYYFVKGLYMQEAFIAPMGVSLVKLIPVTYVKLLLLVLPILGIPYIRKYGEHFTEYIPYFAASGISMLTYPTIAYEYSVPTLFCFIPLLIYWSHDEGVFNSSILRWILGYTFFGFLFVVSNSPWLLKTFHEENITLWIYGLISTLFLLLPLLRPFRGTDRVTTLQNAS